MYSIGECDVQFVNMSVIRGNLKFQEKFKIILTEEKWTCMNFTPLSRKTTNKIMIIKEFDIFLRSARCKEK